MCLFQGGGWELLGVQSLAIVVICTWTLVSSFIILKTIDLTIGLRMSVEHELLGADLIEHAIGNVWYDKKTERIIGKQITYPGSCQWHKDDPQLQFNETRKRRRSSFLQETRDNFEKASRIKLDNVREAGIAQTEELKQHYGTSGLSEMPAARYVSKYNVRKNMNKDKSHKRKDVKRRINTFFRRVKHDMNKSKDPTSFNMTTSSVADITGEQASSRTNVDSRPSESYRAQSGYNNKGSVASRIQPGEHNVGSLRNRKRETPFRTPIQPLDGTTNYPTSSIYNSDTLLYSSTTSHGDNIDSERVNQNPSLSVYI